MSLEPMPPDYDAWRTDPEWGKRPEREEIDDYDQQLEKEYDE